MRQQYDNRIIDARANTAFALDGAEYPAHQSCVETSQQFLARLKAAGVTQGQIADALGIAQPNAATFYTPGKNGKLRTLKWDEGVKLAKKFSLEPPEPTPPAMWSSAETLAPLLDAVLPLVPRSGVTDQSVEALSEALAYGLRLLGESGASPENADALRVAARGAASRFRDLALQ